MSKDDNSFDKDSPFTLETAKRVLGFKKKSEIYDLFDLINGWETNKREHRHVLLHSFFDGESIEAMANTWYVQKKKKPLPIPNQQIHKVRNEVYAKTRRYVLRLMYIRLRRGTFLDPNTKDVPGPMTKRQANQHIWKFLPYTKKCLDQTSIRRATRKCLLEKELNESI